jgi:hypothetical protein
VEATELASAIQSEPQNETPLPIKTRARHPTLGQRSEKTLSRSSTQSAAQMPAIEEVQFVPATNNGLPQPSHDLQPTASGEAEIKSDKLPQDHQQSLKPNQDGRSLSAESMHSKARSKTQVQVPLWIITHEPIYTEERWIDGKFQGAELSDFFQEVSRVTERDHIEKMKLTLQTSTFETKITVLKGDEEEWISAKKTFLEKLKKAVTAAKLKRLTEQPPSFKILIEPFYGETSWISSAVDEDDMEFNF